MARYLHNAADDPIIPGQKPVELTPTEARQGNLGRPVLYVLLAGIVLAMIVWAFVEGWGGAIAPPNDTGTVPAQTTSGNPPAGSFDNNKPAGDKTETAPAYQDTQPNQK